MQSRTLVSLVVLSLTGCAKEAPAPSPEAAAPAAAPAEAADPHAAFTRVEVTEMASLIKDSRAVPVDANGASTRKELGIVPGAVLLSNPRTFELKELPEDKAANLVFYCGGEACTSAPKAALRAQEAGYANVKVMGAGIKGWVKAGQPVDKSRS